MTLTEKVAHLKGLMEGLDINDSTKEGKVLKYIADILEDMALSVCDLEDETDTLNQYIEEIDEDLGMLEDDFYEDYDDDDCDCDCCCDDDDDCDCDCCCDDDDICEFYEVTCPSCGEPVYIDDSIDPSRVICPSCNAEFSDKTED